MSVLNARPRPARNPTLASSATVAALRVAGAGLLATNAGIHAYLWNVGYRTIPTIGPLFLLNAIGASVLTLAVFGAPRRWLPAPALLGALLELGTLGGLVLATQRSLFGFSESTQATLYWQSAITEIAGVAVLGVLCGLTFRQARAGAITSRW